jgi:hypothetical protein
MKIGGDQAYEVAFGGGLRQQVLIGAKDIAQLHAVSERKFARPHDMALHINSALAIGKNRCDVDTIAILHIEGGNLSLDRLGRVGWLGLQGYRFALLVGVDALNRDVVQCRGDGGSAGIVQYVFQCRATFEFINRRPLYHAEDGDLWTSRRNQQRIAGLQALVIHAHAVE